MSRQSSPTPSDNTQDVATTPSPTFAVSRRTVTATAAWSVPAIALVGAAPAYAASDTFTNDPENPEVIPLSRCGVYNLGNVAFVVTATRAISATAAADIITISLPEGLRFLGTPGAGEDARTRFVHPSADTAANTALVVPVPPFTVVGTSGAYTISSSFHGQLAQITTMVTIPVATFRAIQRTRSAPTVSASFSLVNGSLNDSISGSADGDSGYSSSSGLSTGTVASTVTALNSAGTAGGSLKLWGNNTGGTLAAPVAQLQWRYNNNGSSSNTWHQLTGTSALFTRSSVWASVASGGMSDYWGGAAARATTTSGFTTTNRTVSGIFAFFRNGTDDGVSVKRVVGVPTSSTVHHLAAHSGHSYAHVGNAVYWWNSHLSTSGTVNNGNVTAREVEDTAGISLVSTYGSHRTTASNAFALGGAGIANSKLVVWSGTAAGTAPTTTTHDLPVGMGTPVKVMASMSGVVVLDSNRVLWTFNDNAHAISTTNPAAAWFRAPGLQVADFHIWGYHTDLRYLGGSAIRTDGTVVQFLVDGNGWSAAEVVQVGNNEPINGIRRVETSDGTYLALRWDGTLYAWGGNLDNAGRAPASTLSNSLDAALIGNTTVDIGVWGFHDAVASRYTGGGFLLTSVACELDG